MIGNQVRNPKLNVEYEDIVFNEINVDENAEKFAGYIQENKTIFLDGKWGSGKSYFIEKSKKYLSEKNMVFVDLWRTTDNRSATEVIFYELHKSEYYILKYGVFLLIALSVLCTKEVNLGLTFGCSFIDIFAKIFVWTSTAVVILFQFLKRTTDDIYIFFFKWCKNSLENKILVIDDFDRVNPDKQEEAYKIFNILNGDLPILFIGDFEKLVKNEDNYLQKVIDQKLVLPYKLHSSEITNKVDLPHRIKLLFTIENRVPRDLAHFVFLANQELRSKIGHVQREQQLLIIYTYLFHPKIYFELKKGWLPPKTGEDNGEDSKVFDDASDIEMIFSNILEENVSIPKDYRSNPQVYFLYERATSLSISELNNIFENDKELLNYLLLQNESDKIYKEMSFYIKNMVPEMWSSNSKRVENLILTNFNNRIKSNQLSSYVFQHKIDTLETIIREGSRYMNVHFGEPNMFVDFLKTFDIKPTPSENITDGVFTGRQDVAKKEVPFILSEIDKTLSSNKLDISQKLYFYHEFLDISDNVFFRQGVELIGSPRISSKIVSEHFYDDVVKLFSSEGYLSQKFPEQILIAKLGLEHSCLNIGKLKELENYIMSLSSEEFISFWGYYDIVPVKVEQGTIELQGGEVLLSDREFYDKVVERFIELEV